MATNEKWKNKKKRTRLQEDYVELKGRVGGGGREKDGFKGHQRN
jgi:hypothetical protein